MVAKTFSVKCQRVKVLGFANYALSVASSQCHIIARIRQGQYVNECVVMLQQSFIYSDSGMWAVDQSLRTCAVWHLYRSMCSVTVFLLSTHDVMGTAPDLGRGRQTGTVLDLAHLVFFH